MYISHVYMKGIYVTYIHKMYMSHIHEEKVESKV